MHKKEAGSAVKVTKTEVKHIVKALGGKRFPRSGAGLPMEDGTWDIFHIQLKVTRKDKFTLKKSDLVKLVKHATIWGQVPLFVVFFQKHGVYILIYPLPDGEATSVLKATKTITPTGRGVFSTGIAPYPTWAFTPCKKLKETLLQIKETCSKLL